MADLSFPTSKTRRGRVQGDGEICPTLMANNQDLFKLEADEVKKYRIRKLTPRECWRLMGFSDEDFEKAEAVNSNTQLYAQAGNSIVVNVLEAIFGQMIDPVVAGHKPEEEESEDMPETLEKESPKVAVEEIPEEVQDEHEEGYRVNLPVRPGKEVYVAFRGIVLKCAVTYFAIYEDEICSDVIAFDQSPLRTETADLIYLWNHSRGMLKLKDIGTKVFLEEEDAKKAVGT